jgi:PAS domain S-box-containing protein
MMDIFGQKKKESTDDLNNLPLAFAKFKIIYNSQDQPIDLTFLAVNHLLEKIAGKLQDELIDKRLIEVSPELQSFIFERLQADRAKITGSSVYEKEIYIESRKKWFDLHISIPEQDIAIVLLSDCTQRKILEEELIQSEHKYKSLYIDSPVGMYRSSPNGNLITANPALLRTLGFSSFEELADNNPFKTVLKGANPSLGAFTKVHKLDSENGHEFSLVTKSGTTIYIRESAKTILDKNGEPLYIEKTVEDITERKIAELQITELNHLYLEMGVDPQKNIDTIVKKACEIIQCTCSFYNYLDDKENYLITWSGYNAQINNKEQSNPEGHICYEATIKGINKPVVIEDLNTTNFIKTDPNILKYGWRSYLGVPVIVEEKTIGSLCVVGEIPKKFTETEINIIATLAKVLGLEHQRFNSEVNLLKATSEAKNANQAKSQFLANMSHEIRTPLNGIIGFAEMLASQESDERKTQILKMIENSGYQLLQIINDIFDYSRIETGKISIKSENFILDDVVKETANFFQKAAQEKGLQYIINTDKITERHLLGDSDKLKQVMVNVISNAIKFTDEGSVLVIAESSRRDKLIEVKLTIEDTGIGINNDQLGKIFDEFKQLEYYLNKKIKGTGLGLTITKKLLDLMTGNIVVESEQGRGSRFITTIPFKSASGYVENNKEENMSKPEITKKPLNKNVKILLAEDNEANQFLIKAITKSQDWDITVVDNGAEAVEKYKSEKYDIILMDVQMPVMNGYEATKIIRQLEFKKGIHTPIIALTAYAMKSDKDVCIEAGMDDYISKPFKRQQFLDSINGVLSRVF